MKQDSTNFQRGKLLPDDARKEIRELYLSGLSHQSIAEKIRCSVGAVHNELKRSKIKRRPPGVIPGTYTGQKHHAYRQGKRKIRGGYVEVLVGPNHPFISMANEKRYILEHRLKMADFLGRPLTKNETVHHINGNRADNRLSNLQLRQSDHGQGVVRVCLDCGSSNIGHNPIDQK